MDVDILVIGGGFYGCCLALQLRHDGAKVAILEKNQDLLQGASFTNQARVHAGYHYPRSLLTAYRSFLNFPRFVARFRPAVFDGFQHWYAIARSGSRMNAAQFQRIYGSFPAKLEPAPSPVKRWFNPDYVEEVFGVEEYVFDPNILRELLRKELERAEVPVYFGQKAEKIDFRGDGLIDVGAGGKEGYRTKFLFNCTYSQINRLRQSGGMPPLPLKYEWTEMAMVEVPVPFQKTGVTVMDGPFFSLLPFPALGCHSLSHVRYTPHRSWTDPIPPTGVPPAEEASPSSNFVPMVRDAQRFIPALAELKHLKSLFEVKTVLIHNELDDGRPILFHRDGPQGNFFNVLGGKIDNVFDILEILEGVMPSLKK